MQFINATSPSSAFGDLFGIHGAGYLRNVQQSYPDKHLYVIFAEPGDFPEIDKVPVQAFVSHIAINDVYDVKISYDKNNPLAVVFYPEIMTAQHSGHEDVGAEFLNIGTLIHELTHVKQVWDGRMETVGFMKMNWEGVYHEIELKGYLAYPWEEEACMAQLEWLTKGNTPYARRCYKQMVEDSFNIET